MKIILTFSSLVIIGFLSISFMSSALAYGEVRENIMSTSTKLSDLDGYRLEKMKFSGKTSQSSYDSSIKTLRVIRLNIKSAYREGYMTNYEYADIKNEYRYLVAELNAYYADLSVAERSRSRDMYKEARKQ